ncbi:MAG: DNA-binding protein [Candidatus Altiarchaeales archaeon ex4484_2]|nr:MAG: DNA-binding protein [Candidatus Altiarchaeales archaeon ex4484_2]
MNQQILVLYHLSRRFSKGDGILLMSTSEVGEFLGVSQQTASRYLNDLELEGYIKKTRSEMKQRIEFTEKGRDSLVEVYLDLKHFLERGKKRVFRGSIVTGMGEGAYYMGKYENRFRENLGFKPFHGTLNVKLDSGLASVKRYSTGFIEGFRRNERVYGRLEYMPVTLSGNDWSINCFLVFPERTHHREVVEIISDRNLRKEYGLRDGDSVTIEVET